MVKLRNILKKGLVAFIVTLSLASCNNSAPNSDGSYTVTFHMNYKGAKQEIYLQQKVFPNQYLTKPVEPTRNDYVFDGWFKDKKGKKKFTDFYESVNKNLDLYASWSDYDNLTDAQKINLFVDKLSSLTGNVVQTTIERNEIGLYYEPMVYEYGWSDVAIYNRYEDITTVDYYDVDENTTPYATQQFFYDSTYFYNIYNDIENNGVDSYKQTARFNDLYIDSFLNIDFANMHTAILKNLADHLTYPDSDFDILYKIGFNHTYMDPSANYYSYKLDYAIGQTTDLGYYAQNFELEYSVIFENNQIKRSRAVQTYECVLDNSVLTYSITTSTAEYVTADARPEFTGTRLNPNDFKTKS